MPKDNVKISIIFLISNASVAVYYTFLAQLLSSFGFNAQEIGTLLMLSGLLAVGSMPLMGFLTDNFITAKQMMVIDLVISIIGSIIFWNMEKTFLNVALIIALWSFFFKPVINLSEAYTYKLINAGDPVDYGVVRSMGSLGYAIAAYVIGVIIDKTSFYSLYYMQVGFLVVLIISITVFYRTIERKPKNEVTENEVPENEAKTDKVKGVKKENTVKVLFTNRDYVFLIIGGFFIHMAVSLHFTYVPLLLEKNGESTAQIGLAFSIMALSEIPTIAFFSRIRSRVKPTTLITIAGAFYIVRMLGVVIQPTVELFWLMSTLQIVTFGFLSPSYMYIINSVVPSDLSSTATLTAITIIFNLSSVFSMYFGGYFIERLGYETVLSFCWVLSLVGTLIFVFNFKIIKNRNRKAGI